MGGGDSNFIISLLKNFFHSVQLGVRGHPVLALLLY